VVVHQVDLLEAQPLCLWDEEVREDQAPCAHRASDEEHFRPEISRLDPVVLGSTRYGVA
jgi:hypothetical protein